MLMALIWWTVLLFQSNQTVFEYKKQLFQKEMEVVYGITEYNPEGDPIYQKIEAERSRKAKMILGEGLVFGLSLLIGIYLIQRSHYRELKATEQQSNFLLAITHELKSPLTAIKMGLQTIMIHKLGQNLQDEIVNDSLEESNRLEELINKLLLTSRIHGGYNYQFDNHNLKHHLENFLNLKYSDTLNINLEVPNVIKIIYDAGAFEIVFSNLIDNAKKYGAKNLTIKAELWTDKLKISFIDDGFGIPVKEKNEIFKKFYRIGSEETRKTKGTGLGLYIVKQIIVGHKGNISVKNNKTKGCNFEIMIPRKN